MVNIKAKKMKQMKKTIVKSTELKLILKKIYIKIFEEICIKMLSKNLN